MFSKVDVTLKTADALLILEAGRLNTVEVKSMSFTKPVRGAQIHQ